MDVTVIKDRMEKDQELVREILLTMTHISYLGKERGKEEGLGRRSLGLLQSSEKPIDSLIGSSTKNIAPRGVPCEADMARL